jgi:iron complex transport system substrate-binding protein
MKKKTMARCARIALIAAALGASVAAGAQPGGVPSRIFVDSAGRQVAIPAKVERIAPSGPLAQIVLYSLVPERLVGWALKPTTLVKRYLPRERWDLPTFGQFYGKNANLNLEALIAAKPDVIIDIGEAKKTVREDMDGIQEQTGIPVIFVEATLDTMKRAYLDLGEITGERTAAKLLSDYCAKAIDGARATARDIPAKRRLKVYYGEGPSGLQTNPQGSIHADVLELVGATNVATIPITSGAGGNQITMEQLLLWDPDVIILAPGGVYEAIGTDPLWKDLRAVKEGRYYEIPEGPYNWMGRPPAINRIIGIAWLGSLLYPDCFKDDISTEAKAFYRLFYHYELGDAELNALLERSRPRR